MTTSDHKCAPHNTSDGSATSPAVILEEIGCQLANAVRHVERCRNLHSRFPDEVDFDLECATGAMLDAALAARRLRDALDETPTGEPFTHMHTFAKAATRADEAAESDGERAESQLSDPATPEQRLLLKIVRDALMDICLQGHGSHGRLEVVRGDGMVKLTVEDGHGNDDAELLTTGDEGRRAADIPGLRARTAILGGELSAQRGDGCGLRITARIPLAHVVATPPTGQVAAKA
ncbi:MAG: hypothetical protein R3C10_12850 [Pirellulales bacterium]